MSVFPETSTEVLEEFRGNGVKNIVFELELSLDVVKDTRLKALARARDCGQGCHRRERGEELRGTLRVES